MYFRTQASEKASDKDLGGDFKYVESVTIKVRPKPFAVHSHCKHYQVYSQFLRDIER